MRRNAVLLSHPYATRYGRVGPVLPIGLLNHNLSFLANPYLDLEVALLATVASALSGLGASTPAAQQGDVASALGARPRDR